MDIARNLLDWSMGPDAIYQVGSHLYAGKPVKREWVDKALIELQHTLVQIGHLPTYSDDDRNDLRKLIEELNTYRNNMPKEG
jgi:hypothetical protein